MKIYGARKLCVVSVMIEEGEKLNIVSEGWRGGLLRNATNVLEEIVNSTVRMNMEKIPMNLDSECLGVMRRFGLRWFRVILSQPLQKGVTLNQIWKQILKPMNQYPTKFPEN